MFSLTRWKEIFSDICVSLVLHSTLKWLSVRLPLSLSLFPISINDGGNTWGEVQREEDVPVPDDSLSLRIIWYPNRIWRRLEKREFGMANCSRCRCRRNVCDVDARDGSRPWSINHSLFSKRTNGNELGILLNGSPKDDYLFSSLFRRIKQSEARQHRRRSVAVL